MLYPYQSEIVADVRAAFARRVRRVLLVSPTGSGKTVMFSFIARGAMERGKRVGILVHRDELLGQVSDALAAQGVPHGRIAAGEPETDAPVQVASVDTLKRRLARANVPGGNVGFPAFDLLVPDEAHHAVAGSWRAVLDAYPEARVLGVTATPERFDGQGLGSAFDAMVLGPSVAELTAGRYLVPAIVYAPPGRPDLSGVRVRRGDYVARELAALMSDEERVEAAVLDYQRRAAGLPAVAFCTTLEHSRLVAERFRTAGIRAAHVDGETPRDERRRLVAGLGTGEVEVLTNASLVSEGFDVPVIGAALLLRPTMSLSLHLQQVGRALRRAPGKARAIILDHSGNSYRHDLPDAPRTWTLEDRPRQGRGGRLPGERHRVCRACDAIHGAGTPSCAACGAVLAPGPVEVAEIRAAVAEERRALERARTQLRGMSYAAALRWAGADERRLGVVAQVRGYRHGWVRHRLKEARPAQSAP